MVIISLQDSCSTATATILCPPEEICLFSPVGDGDKKKNPMIRRQIFSERSQIFLQKSTIRGNHHRRHSLSFSLTSHNCDQLKRRALRSPGTSSRGHPMDARNSEFTVDSRAGDFITAFQFFLFFYYVHLFLFFVASQNSVASLSVTVLGGIVLS